MSAKEHSERATNEEQLEHWLRENHPEGETVVVDGEEQPDRILQIVWHEVNSCLRSHDLHLAALELCRQYDLLRRLEN
jgi:hypothetical protein